MIAPFLWLIWWPTTPPAAAPPAIFAVSPALSLLSATCVTRAFIGRSPPSEVMLSKSSVSVGLPPIVLLPETTSVTEPCTRAPAFATVLPFTTRSCVRLPETRWPTFAVLVEISAGSCTDSDVPAGIT